MFVKKLRFEIGRYITLQKMDSAMQDVRRSRAEHAKEYAPLFRETNLGMEELYVRVIGRNVAPPMPEFTIALPAAMSAARAHFETWYHARSQQRKVR